jgi:hypothetical protein
MVDDSRSERGGDGRGFVDRAGVDNDDLIDKTLD